MRANAGATGPYLIAYAVTLASFTVIWFNYPIYLSIGRDASLSLWLALPPQDALRSRSAD